MMSSSDAVSMTASRPASRCLTASASPVSPVNACGPTSTPASQRRRTASSAGVALHDEPPVEHVSSRVDEKTSAAVADERDVVGHALEIAGDVRREQHRRPPVRDVGGQALEQDAPEDRVEAGGRLVEHQQFGVVRERERQRGFRPRAARQATRTACSPAPRTRASAPRTAAGPRSAVEPRDDARDRAHAEVVVVRGHLVHEPDPVLHGRARAVTGRRRTPAARRRPGGTRPSISFTMVVFPAPFGPMSPQM